ncbi:MAG: molecular chaperone DnaJ [Pseudomonadota bacterium]|nr:molecular chaperone DnaJ [Pseudomonadota bacterium]
MRLLVFLAAAIIVFVFLRWIAGQPRAARYQFIAVAVGLGLVVAAATGRLSWIAAVIGAALPFVRRLTGLLGYLPLANRLYRQYGQGSTGRGDSGPSGRVSRVRTRFLNMTLDHDSGEIDGVIVSGPHQDRRLGELKREELTGLFDQYQAADEESASLLAAYLDKRFGEDWRSEPASGTPASGGSEMTREQALEILGLAPGAAREEIIDAHRRLMQKLHPDRGGSNYLAARVNLAKDILLG